MCKYETRADVVRKYADILRACSTAGLHVDDWRYLAIYDDIMRLRNDGLKMEYCVNYASERYGINVARIWRMLRHFKSRV